LTTSWSSSSSSSSRLLPLLLLQLLLLLRLLLYLLLALLLQLLLLQSKLSLYDRFLPFCLPFFFFCSLSHSLSLLSPTLLLSLSTHALALAFTLSRFHSNNCITINNWLSCSGRSPLVVLSHSCSLSLSVLILTIDTLVLVVLFCSRSLPPSLQYFCYQKTLLLSSPSHTLSYFHSHYCIIYWIALSLKVIPYL